MLQRANFQPDATLKIRPGYRQPFRPGDVFNERPAQPPHKHDTMYRMNPVSRTQSAALQTYKTEYMSAFPRTESFGLKAPPRVLVRKPCVNPDRTLPVLLDYFDRDTPKGLMGQTLAINADLIYLLWHKTHVAFELTFGVVDVKGERYGECSEDTIRRYLADKLVAWQRDGVPFHVWLTSPALEVLDITWAMNLGSAKTREACARRIIYKPLDVPHNNPPTYHPVIVGEDFLYQTGCILDLQERPL